jgi:uncharacterized membrane-anchored protein
MTGLNKKLAAALAVPIACLALLTAYKGIKVYAGKKIIIPIVGYDPRDLLSGHYLIFRLDLNTDACADYDHENENVFLCLTLDETDTVTESSTLHYLSDDWRDYCHAVLRGRCDRGSYVAGIERFYIPEHESAALDRAVRTGKGSLVVSVDNSGRASIKELLIDGKPWRKSLEAQPGSKKTR